MTPARPNLFTRDDTFFGVCEGLGQDLRIPPDLLRLAFVPALFFVPVWAIAAYAVLGLLVLSTRLIWPDRPAAAPAYEPVAPAAHNDETPALPLVA